MQTHTLKRKTPLKKSRQIARGGKRGKTGGRGTKGQKARAGRKIRPEMRDIIKKLPKLRGRGKNSLRSIQTKPNVVNLGSLNEFFNAGDTVNPKTLAEKGLIPNRKSGRVIVKILGGGELSKKLTIQNCIVSKEIKEKIEKIGGTIVE